MSEKVGRVFSLRRFLKKKNRKRRDLKLKFKESNGVNKKIRIRIIGCKDGATIGDPWADPGRTLVCANGSQTEINGCIMVREIGDNFVD